MHFGKFVAISLCVAGALLSQAVSAEDAAIFKHGPLQVSENKRFLVYKDGTPFFWLGDTAWEIFHRLNREEANRYLENRAKKGFTVIQAVAVAEFDGNNVPNAYGHLPFVEMDPTRPDVKEGQENDYWDHVDYIVDKAQSLGLYVGFLPTWGRYWHDAVKDGKPLFNEANAESYGEWLGKRYKDKAIVWILGGDHPIDNDEQKAVIRAMAEGRTQCTLQTEKKRTRNRWRFHDTRHGDVYKTTYICPDYAVGSDQGGILQPIQQHSWDVTWKLPDHRGKQNTLFALHPYSGLHELQSYFTFMPDFGTEVVVRSKKTYDSPDKFLGGSPFEQVAQNRDTVVALYQIPAGTRFEHINGFFSRDLEQMEEDASGWIFAQGGRTYIAFRALAPYRWEAIDDGGKRMVSEHLNNGVIMQVASAGEFRSWEEFKSKIKSLRVEATLDPTPKVKFRTLRGAEMECVYGQTPRVNGVDIDYSKWQAFDGPMIRQKRGSRVVEFSAGGLRRTLNFDTWTTE